MNQFVTGWHLTADRFARAGARFGDNATRYYEHVRERDLFLTHMLINPQIDRSKTSAQQEDPFLHLGRVRETADGIVVRGAKMLGTMAPITEEVAVIPFGGVPPGDDAYALAFGIPTNTPGLKFICRETVAPLPRSRFDHPLSSRFEEMDCIAVFDDVLVPWDRVMVDGSPGSGEIINTLGADFGALLNVQTAARMLSQLEFFCGLGMKVADAIGITGFLHVQEKLGEMLSQMEVARAVFYGSEAMAQRLPNGVWVPGGPGSAPFISRRARSTAGSSRSCRRWRRAGSSMRRPRPTSPIPRCARTSTSTSAGAPGSRRRSASRSSSSPGTSPASRSPSAWRSTCASTRATRSGSPPASTPVRQGAAPRDRGAGAGAPRRRGHPRVARQPGLADSVPAGRAGHGGNVCRDVAAAPARRWRRAAGLAPMKQMGLSAA